MLEPQKVEPIKESSSKENESHQFEAKESIGSIKNNRPEQIQLQSIAAKANNSLQAKQLRRFKESADNSQHLSQLKTVQMMATKSSNVIQRYPTQNGITRRDAVIYIIYVNNGATNGSNILYVGQTTKDREFERFQEHTRDDTWAPWYIHSTPAGLDYSGGPATWPYDYAVVEDLKDVTKFETTVAEQWWMEHYLKKGLPLLNDSTPCTIGNFNKRSVNPSLYDHKRIGVGAGYKPSLKAKGNH